MDRCLDCPRRLKPECGVCGSSSLTGCPCCAVPPRANCEEDTRTFCVTLTYLPDGFHVKAAHILRLSTSACRALPVTKDGLTLSGTVQAVKALTAIGGKCSVSPELISEYPQIPDCPLRRKLILNM